MTSRIQIPVVTELMEIVVAEEHRPKTWSSLAKQASKLSKYTEHTEHMIAQVILVIYTTEWDKTIWLSSKERLISWQEKHKDAITRSSKHQVTRDLMHF